MKPYGEGQFEGLCRSACAGYPYTNEADPAAAELSLLWLISFKVCGLLDTPLLLEREEGDSLSRSFRRSLRAWGVALGALGCGPRRWRSDTLTSAWGGRRTRLPRTRNISERRLIEAFDLY
jgi:hypothetical protein